MINYQTQLGGKTTQFKTHRQNSGVPLRMYISPAFHPVSDQVNSKFDLITFLIANERPQASRPWKKHCSVTSAFLWCVIKRLPRSVLLRSSLSASTGLFSWKRVCIVALVTHTNLRE